MCALGPSAGPGAWLRHAGGAPSQGRSGVPCEEEHQGRGPGLGEKTAPCGWSSDYLQSVSWDAGKGGGAAELVDPDAV